MDTSEVYIKMCERAEETQEKWVHHVGDWLIAKKEYIGTSNGGVIRKNDLCIVMNEFHDGGIELGVQARATNAGYSYMRKGHCIWLPRQDQLQEMLVRRRYNEITSHNLWNDYQLAARFSEFVFGQAGKEDSPYTSMEQLWLAFVMNEKYGKVWSGEDWEYVIRGS